MIYLVVYLVTVIVVLNRIYVHPYFDRDGNFWSSRSQAIVFDINDWVFSEAKELDEDELFAYKVGKQVLFVFMVFWPIFLIWVGIYTIVVLVFKRKA